MDELETFGGRKARLVADKSDPRMLPRQASGICYMHTALNTILNCPRLLATVMNSLKSRIDGSKYGSALGGENLRKLDRRLTISDGDFIGKAGVVGMDVINDVIAKISDRDADEELKQWCKDTILYTALRDAKAADFKTYPMNYENDLSADALYLAVGRQEILADNDDIGMKTLVRAGEGGNQLITLFDILKSVGATVDGTSSDQHIATFADGTCVVAEKTLVPENTKPTIRSFLMKADPAVNEKNLREIADKCNGWDRTGNLVIRRMHLSANPVEEGHGVVYFRDEDHKMRVIDSNHHRNWSIDEYLEEMKKTKSRMASSGGPPKMTMDEYPWMITEVITYFTAKVVRESQTGGGPTAASGISDALASQIAGACVPMSEEAQIAGGVLRRLLTRGQQTMG
jgi:hypothetical protein